MTNHHTFYNIYIKTHHTDEIRISNIMPQHGRKPTCKHHTVNMQHLVRLWHIYTIFTTTLANVNFTRQTNQRELRDETNTVVTAIVY